MTRSPTQSEIARVRRDYPELWNFMEAHFNSACVGWLYEDVSDAAKDYADINPEYLTHRLLNQARRARADAALNAIMHEGLATASGGMALLDEGWANLISALETCLPDKGGGDAQHASWPP